MPIETAVAREATSPYQPQSFAIPSAFAAGEAIRTRLLRPWSLGLLMMVIQLVVAVFLLSPDGPLSFRYQSLVQHDGYWFANIIDRGYQTIVPPINHKVMEVSNVAFFPAYPALAAAIRAISGVETETALLIAAQLAAWGFWTYFFLFCERWKLSPALRFFGALSILAHPAAFFLVALIGFIYWSNGEGRAARILAALHGIIMSATRIVGVPCAAYPVVRAVFKKGWSALRAPRRWFQNYSNAAITMIVAICGAIAFFVYCQWRWGRWDMYMLTQAAGWNIEPDYLAVFRLSSYRWLFPQLHDPTQMSQMSMTVGALLLVTMAIAEIIPAFRRVTEWQTRIGLYFCAAVIYYISVSGVASLEMESMLRYEFCVHTLIVLAFLHYVRQFRVPSPLLRALGIATAVLLSALGLAVQGWYIWNFTRGNWVA
jgi:hypothetical protein